MNLSGGIVNLVARAIQFEAKGNSIAEKFISLDGKARGMIATVPAIGLVCEILRVPAPTGDDPESVAARKEILEDVGFKIIVDPVMGEAVKYGKFLQLFRDALEKSPLAETNPYAGKEEVRGADAKKKIKKSDLTTKEINKVMDENLPKYYRSTTEAFLRMKPPGGVLGIDDFARFMRSINLDLPDEKLRELFDTYDKNKSGGLEAWEFIESFGPAINGHVDTSTSLFLPGHRKRREPKTLREVHLNAEQTRDLIMARLPFHYKSSTKAFLAAKGGVNPRSHTIEFKDLKVWLQNLNIIVPDDTIMELFKYLDEDGSGDVTANEFIKAFGCAISGERSDNILDAEHLSFHNTRPDKHISVIPAKHQWTYEEVKKSLGDRLGLIHTSTTKAFMKAKRSTSDTMSVADLKRMLINLNIDPPDSVVRRIYRELDKDGDGQVGCAEFIEVFGNDINGHSGSFESKPAWYIKEMAALKAHLNKLETSFPKKNASVHSVSDHEGHIPDDKETWQLTRAAPGASLSSPKGKAEATTKAQDLKFKKKFGVSPDAPSPHAAKVKTSPVGSQAEAFPSSGSVGGALPQRPRSAGSVRSSPSVGGGQSVGGGSASVSGASGQRSGASVARSTQAAAPNAPAATAAPQDENERVEYIPGGQRTAQVSQYSVPDEPLQQIPPNSLQPFYTQPKGFVQPERPSTAGSAREMSKFTNVDLINELRVRQLAQQAELVAKQEARRVERPRSAPHRRPQEQTAGPGAPMDPSWDAPTSRFGGFNQGSHGKSTVATKLSRAKKMADVYHQQEMRRNRSRSRSSSVGRTRGGQGESDYWQIPRDMHDGTFRV